MSFQPLGAHVIVKHLERRDRTQSGIYLPIDRDNSLMPTRIGKVIALGSQATKVKKGETVVIRWSQHRAIKSNGAECRIVHEDKILGVLDGQ